MLHAGEPGCEIGGAEPTDIEFARPVLERRCRRTKARGPVDGSAAADAATLQNIDRLVLGLARRRFLIQLGICFRLAHMEIGRCRQRSFLDQNHVETRVAQDFRRRSSTRTRADNDDVRLEGEML